MQLQMKLGGETLAAFDMVSFIFTGDRDANISKGYIVERLVEKYYPRFDSIDWVDVRDYELEQDYPFNTGLQTALVLSEETIEQLTDMQKKFVKIFDTKRIYKPFVIKMLLLASLMDYENESGESHGEQHNNVFDIATLNCHDFDGNEPWNNELLKNKEKRINDIYASTYMSGVIALQEYIPEGDKWLKCWDDDEIDFRYHVITPEGWSKDEHPYSTLALTLIMKDEMESYEPLRLDDDEDFQFRYTYGILTSQSGRKVRLMNVYMMCASKDPSRNEKSKKFWKSVLKEVELQKNCEEEFFVVGDFNAFDGEESLNRDNLIKLQTLMVDIDIDAAGEPFGPTYYHEGQKERKLDYIFINKKTVFKYSLFPECDDDVVKKGASDHCALRCEIAETVEKVPLSFF